MKTTLLLSSLLVLASVTTVRAQAVDFKVGGTRAQQLASVESVTDFETFTGRTDKVSGTIRFDPKTKKGTGKVVVDAASIDTGIDLRNDHMRSAGWLDTAKHSDIVFEVTNTKSKGKDQYEVTGNLTMKGVTKSIKAIASVKHLIASDATAKAGFKGDVLQVRSTFSIKLADYGVVIPAPAKGKVGESVSISISLYAQSGS